MKVQGELIELNEIAVVAKIPKLTELTKLPELAQPNTGKNCMEVLRSLNCLK